MKKTFLLFACIFHSFIHGAQVIKNRCRNLTTTHMAHHSALYLQSNNQFIPQNNKYALYPMKYTGTIDYHKKSCNLITNLLLTSMLNDIKASQEFDAFLEADEVNLLLKELNDKGW